MKAIFSGRKTAAIISVLGITGYLIFDLSVMSSNPALTDFFRGFFTGISIVAMVMFFILYITSVLKRRRPHIQ